MTSPDGALSRTFSLGAILTALTDRVLVADFGELHELLDFMTGDKLFTHQIPRAAGECKADLLRQHPQLEGLAVPVFAEPAAATVPAWMAEQAARFGSHLDVSPLPPGVHLRINPIDELLAMRAPKEPAAADTDPDPLYLAILDAITDLPPDQYALCGQTAEVAANAVREFVAAAHRPAYRPALIHGRKSTLWVHGCGHVESWPTDPKYPPIEGEGCDACESAPDGTWRQLYMEVPGE